MPYYIYTTINIPVTYTRVLICFFFIRFTIQRVQENSEIIWKYNRYTLIRKYYEKPKVPVPVAINLWRLFRFVYKKCSSSSYEDLFGK